MLKKFLREKAHKNGGLSKLSVAFYIHPWEVILWEVLIAMNTGICIYMIYKIKRGEFYCHRCIRKDDDITVEMSR